MDIAAGSACAWYHGSPRMSHGHRCLLCLRLVPWQPQDVPQASQPALPTPMAEKRSPAEGQLPGVSSEMPVPLQHSPFQSCSSVASHSAVPFPTNLSLWNQ